MMPKQSLYVFRRNIGAHARVWIKMGKIALHIRKERNRQVYKTEGTKNNF